MKIISKFLLSIITLLIFSFIFYVTFLLKNENLLENFHFEKIENGTFEINKLENNNFSLNKINDIKKGSVLLENISSTSRFFLVNWNFTKTSSGSNTTINIEPWIYLFELNDIDNNIIIESNWYRINNFSNWTFFINSLNPEKNLIFSIDSIINIEILNTDNKELLTNAILYPHFYFFTDPKKNYRVKWWNLLRINQILNLQFFKEKIFPTKNIINEKILDLLSLKNSENLNYIKNIFDFIKNDFENNLNIWNNNLYEFPWENYIKKYFYLFFNDEKKKIYYKDLIIKNIFLLSNSNNIRDNKIDFIIENLTILETLDSKLGNEIKDIINYIYINKIKSKDISIENRIIFYNLLAKIQNKKIDNPKLNSTLFLKKIFINYDLDENYNLFKDIFLFKDLYFKDLWLNNNNKEKVNKNKIDYLLYFLENIINMDIKNKELYVEKIIILFKDYVEILSQYSDINDSTNNKTLIYKLNIILKNLWETIKSIYFENVRNNSNLLERKKENKWINKNDLNNLNVSLSKLVSFIKTISIKLEKNADNDILIKNYNNNIEIFKEYISALEDYEKYKIKYDKNIIELINWNWNLINKKNWYITTVDELKEYLNWFYWLNISNINIEEKDYNYCKNWNSITEYNKPNFVMECFFVDNVYLYEDLKPISLLFFPYENNKIEVKIEVKKDEIKTRIYELNTIEEWLNEKLKASTTDEDKQKYDFKNFFINNFSTQKIDTWNQNIEITEDQKVQEEKYIRSFKWILLSDSWDFSLLKWFLNIKYNDLIVEKIKEKYIITIKDTLLNTNIENWNDSNDYKLIFNSNYTSQNFHNFENINIKIKDPNDKEEKTFIIWWNTINIIWIVNITSLENVINNLLSQIESITNTYNITINTLNPNEINLYYHTEKDYFEIISEYNNKKLIIEIKSWKIIKINYDWNNIIKSQIQISELKNILNTIL